MGIEAGTCGHCGAVIPVFQNLSQVDADRLRQIIASGGAMHAINELRAITGCDITTAKCWVEHLGKVQDRFFRTAPCPFCGEPLRASDAKQCRHCRRDWHDPQNVRTLGS